MQLGAVQGVLIISQGSLVAAVLNACSFPTSYDRYSHILCRPNHSHGHVATVRDVAMMMSICTREHCDDRLNKYTKTLLCYLN